MAKAPSNDAEPADDGEATASIEVEGPPERPDRRRFIDHALRLSTVGLVAAGGYPVFRYLTPAARAGSDAGTMELGAVKEFAVGSSRIVRFGDRTVIVVRDATGQFHALSALCTHLQCVVSYDPEAKLLTCGCHHGAFALTGRNVAGPPPRPLQVFPVRVVGDQLILGAA